MDFNAYWDTCTAIWQDASVKCGRHYINGSKNLTEAQSHDEGRWEQEFTGVQQGYRSKV